LYVSGWSTGVGGGLNMISGYIYEGVPRLAFESIWIGSLNQLFSQCGCIKQILWRPKRSKDRGKRNVLFFPCPPTGTSHLIFCLRHILVSLTHLGGRSSDRLNYTSLLEDCGTSQSPWYTILTIFRCILQ
jgi:hypothetical protein